MRLRIKATNLELTPALRVQVRRKIFMPVRRVLAEPDSAPTLMDVELARTDTAAARGSDNGKH
jgi:ribosome-associated translation inhibitor RaiA